MPVKVVTRCDLPVEGDLRAAVGFRSEYESLVDRQELVVIDRRAQQALRRGGASHGEQKRGQDGPRALHSLGSSQLVFHLAGREVSGPWPACLDSLPDFEIWPSFPCLGTCRKVLNINLL